MALRITLLSLRRRLLDDHDAVAYSMKPLTDAIAETLGLDDADPRLRWQYSQARTGGEEGVVVVVQEEASEPPRRPRGRPRRPK